MPAGVRLHGAAPIRSAVRYGVRDVPAGEQLLDPVQNRAPLPVRGLVGAHLLELGRGEPLEALDHLRRRQAVVPGDGERRAEPEPLGPPLPSHTDGRHGVGGRVGLPPARHRAAPRPWWPRRRPPGWPAQSLRVGTSTPACGIVVVRVVVIRRLVVGDVVVPVALVRVPTEMTERLLELAPAHLEGELAHEAGRVHLALDAVATLLDELGELLDEGHGQAGRPEHHELEQPVSGRLVVGHLPPSSGCDGITKALTRSPGTAPFRDRPAGWSA